uniref:C2 DOCK-type domain-containing protein n=1 Tax=Trichobilharzia regenti TaxID=157069 RepID=A0AA85KMS2_TRIRE|nr:unnamed protein product [Trichobilharzia regenti]
MKLYCVLIRSEMRISSLHLYQIDYNLSLQQLFNNAYHRIVHQYIVSQCKFFFSLSASRNKLRHKYLNYCSKSLSDGKQVFFEKKADEITGENSQNNEHHNCNLQNNLPSENSAMKSLLRLFSPSARKDAFEVRQLSPGCKWPSEPINGTNNYSNATLYLLTEFIQLRLDDGDLEPIFGSAFIYDVHSRLKVSETFHFDVNSNKLMNLFSGSMTNQQLAYRDASSLAQTCLFRMSSRYTLSSSADLNNNPGLKSQLKTPSSGGSTDKIGVNINNVTNENDSDRNDEFGLEDILSFASNRAEKQKLNPNRVSCCQGGLFLIIRVEKVLQQGDINDIMEGYNKDEKNKDKLKSTINWCCQRLGRYRMPLVWTAVDLTPYMIEARNKFLRMENDGSNHIKSKIATSSDSSRQNTIGSTRSRSVEPGLRNHHIEHNNNNDNSLCDSISSKGIPNSQESYGRKAKYERIKEMAAENYEKHLHRNTTKCPTVSEQFDSTEFLPIELKITNFFKQEPDRINDDELFRYVNDIHRQTVSAICRISCTSTSPTSVTSASVNNNASVNQDISSLSFSNISLTLSTAFSPTSGSVRRFKTFSNLSLHLRLRWASPQNLIKLLKSMHLETQTCIPSEELNQLNESSVILLNPESLSYTGSIFQSFNDFSMNKLDMNSTVSPRIPNLIREVLELPSIDLLIPFTSYRNLLYVYPKSVSLPPSKQASSRNITVRVQLMYSDSNVTKVLPAIYGKSNSPKFISDAFTAVLYHNRSPEFYDEIKIQLPAHLEQTHYLLFTFYHIICQSKKVESTATLETVIGYSWLPLLEQGYLKNNDVNLLVSVEKPSPALAMVKPNIKSITEKFCMDACKWVDAHRELFSVSTTVVSSVYMQDASLECLLSACHQSRINGTIESFTNKAAVRQLFTNINKTSLHQLIAYFTPLLDGFLRLLFSCIIKTFLIKMNNTHLSENIQIIQRGVIALELLIAFLNRISLSFAHLNDKHGRNQLLVSYLNGSQFLPTKSVLRHYFSGHPLFGLPLVSNLINVEEIDKNLLVNIILTELVKIYLCRTKLIDCQSSQTFFPSLWFLLELFIHLLAQDWYLTVKTDEPKLILSLCENPCFLEDLSTFNTCLTEYMIRYVCGQHNEKSEDLKQWEPYRLINRIFSFFLHDLISFLPLEFIVSETANYWTKIDQLLIEKELNPYLSDKLLKYFKLDLLQIICSHEAFYQLNSESPLPMNCDQLLQQYHKLSIFNNDHHLRQEAKSKHIPLATIEPDFYGTEDSHHLGDKQYSHMFGNNIDGKSTSLNKHFFISLIIYELITALKSDVPDLQDRAVDLLWSVLINNELNLEQETPQNTSSSQSITSVSQLAYFYLPILNVVCDFLPNLVKTWQINRSQSRKSSNGNSVKPRQQSTDEMSSDKLTANLTNDLGTNLLSSGRMRRTRRNTKTTKFLEVGPGISSVAKETPTPRFTQCSENTDFDCVLRNQLDSVKSIKSTTMKRLFIITIWILKHTPDSLCHEWLHQASVKERNQLFLLIYLILDTFRIKSREKSDSLLNMNCSPVDSEEHAECENNIDGCENESHTTSSQTKLSNDPNLPNNHVSKRFRHDQMISAKFSSPESPILPDKLDYNNNNNINPSISHSSQRSYSRPSILKMKNNFTRSNSFSLGSYSNGTDSPGLHQNPSALRKSLLFNDIVMVICNLLDSSIEGLWQLDTALGRPGLTLFTFYNYSFNCILPYKKSNATANNNNTNNSSALSNQCLIGCIIRVMLYALSLSQSVTGYQRILLCLRRVISRFPSFLFEDNPEFCSVCCHHLLTLCTRKHSAVRDDAVATLYFLMKNYYTLTNGLSFVKVHLYLTFSSFFTKLVSGMKKSNSILSECSNNTNYQDNLSNSSISAFKTYLTDSLSQLKHLTLSDDDLNIPKALLNHNHEETLFNAEKYTESVSLTSPSSLNNFDDVYNNTVSMVTTTTTTTIVPAIPLISNIPNTGFNAQVCQLADNLKQLLNDALRLQDVINTLHRKQQTNDYRKQISNEDTLITIDLLHSISHRSRISPELRLYWLLQIAEKHYELTQFSEASQCLAHCTAIVAEHLVNRGSSPLGLSKAGCSDIADAVKNLNILEESCACGFPSTGVYDNFSCSIPVIPQDLSASLMPLDVSWHFTTPGFMALVSWTAESFAKAGFYEIVPCLYSRLVALLQSSNDYGRLAEIHGRIRDSYALLNKTQNNKKMFNSYFRVGFHGDLFGDLNGNDFIYKEAPYTKLAEITSRLQTFYEAKFGQGKVIIIKDSNIVDPKQLDTDKAYLQITFVEPYLEDFELRRRPTEFHCNYALKRFVHSTPFTIDGQTHGSLSTQYKRKYILTTARCFPYMKTRLLVVSAESHTLTPIEVALEDVTRRVEQLDRALTTDPPDVKYLQMILQGCIGAMVNQGPIEMATTFLGQKENKPIKATSGDKNISFTTLDPNAYEDVQNRLRITFQIFLIKSYEALCLNESLIGPDQIEYHKELEKNFMNVKRLLDPLIIISKPPVTNGDTIMNQNNELKPEAAK